MKQSLSLIFLITTAIQVSDQNHVNMNINQDAPVVQSKEIIINAPVDKIWEVLTKVNQWDQWNSKIKKPNLGGDLMVGSIFTWKINGSKITSTVHPFSENQLLGWTGKTFGAKAIHNWYLEPTDAGTKVVVEESMEGWLIGLMKKKMNKILEEDMVYWLEQLKIASEQ